MVDPPVGHSDRVVRREWAVEAIRAGNAVMARRSPSFALRAARARALAALKAERYLDPKVNITTLRHQPPSSSLAVLRPRRRDRADEELEIDPRPLTLPWVSKGTLGLSRPKPCAAHAERRFLIRPYAASGNPT
jgi:hypothetical protein